MKNEKSSMPVIDIDFNGPQENIYAILGCAANALRIFYGKTAQKRLAK